MPRASAQAFMLCQKRLNMVAHSRVRSLRSFCLQYHASQLRRVLDSLEVAGILERHDPRGRDQQPRALALIWSRPIAIAVDERHGGRDLPIVVAGFAP